MNFFKALLPHIFLITILPLSCEISGSTGSNFQRKQAFTEDSGKVYLPKGDAVQTISVSKKGNNFEVTGNPLSGKTTFRTQWQN